MANILTPKQAKFVQEYLVDLNATQAAIRAGYSEETACSIGCENLSKPNIAEAIQSSMDERADRTMITADKVLSEVARLAFADPAQLFDEDGRLLPVRQLPIAIRRSIASVEVVTRTVPGSDPAEVEHTSKIRFWDKRGSLELLGKHLKLFNDRVEHTGANGGPIETKDVNLLEVARRVAFLLASGTEQAQPEQRTQH